MKDGKDVVVADLDGTLCDDGHRAHLAKQGLWDDYHAGMNDDVPFVDVLTLLQAIPVSMDLVILTARPFKYLVKTQLWLEKHEVFPESVLMRPDGDYASAAILKPRLLEEYFGSKERALERVAFILEDHDPVVQAWREYGIPCWQVRAGTR